MVTMPTEANWQVTFPGNLRWSNATQIVKGMVAYGAAAAAEIDQITRRLKARSGEPNLDTVWMEEWSREADRVAKIGDEADAAGHSITAGNQYMRAGNYYYSAERFIPPGEEKLAMYRKALRCYQSAMRRLHPDIERVEVPYESATLPAWFVKGKGLGKRPTVVLFDGMDNAKEMSVIFAGLDLAKRGINVLAIDGPGQSEPLRLNNIPSRHDYEAAGIPAYNYVTSRPEVDPKRVAVMGYSFGGYHAPRICAFDKRYAACVCFGAMHWNVHDFVKGHAPTDPRQTSGSTFQWRWVVGAPDVATALEWSKKFTLEGVADKVTCPILILHGENDRVVPLEEAKKLYERVGSKNKTLRIFTEAEGGAEHCQVDNRQLGVDFIGDWLLKNM
ncbi:MAG: alpha/beta hydrolase [Xanthobacteraceae bacterium]|nr:alpha/beta hydrolase [Xanthobacteraceae bacterium]